MIYARKSIFARCDFADISPAASTPCGDIAPAPPRRARPSPGTPPPPAPLAATRTPRAPLRPVCPPRCGRTVGDAGHARALRDSRTAHAGRELPGFGRTHGDVTSGSEHPCPTTLPDTALSDPTPTGTTSTGTENAPGPARLPPRGEHIPGSAPPSLPVAPSRPQPSPPSPRARPRRGTAKTPRASSPLAARSASRSRA